MISNNTSPMEDTNSILTKMVDEIIHDYSLSHMVSPDRDKSLMEVMRKEMKNKGIIDMEGLSKNKESTPMSYIQWYNQQMDYYYILARVNEYDSLHCQES